MKRNEVIDELIKNPDYKEICFKLFNSLKDDLFQEIVLTILEYDEKKLERIEDKNQCKVFIYVIACNMARSKYSTFRKKHLGKYGYEGNYFNELPENLQIKDESKEITWEENGKLDKLIDVVNNENWFDRDLFKKYLEEGSLRSLEQKTGIKTGFAHKVISKYKERIKKKMEPFKILLISQETDDALKYFRQVIPHEELGAQDKDIIIEMKIGTKANGKTYEGTIDDATDEWLKQYKIVLFLRQITFKYGDEKRIIDRLHGLGIKVILDIDDYWKLDRSHILKEQYKVENVEKATENTLKAVDYVTTTTDEFAAIIGEFNKNVSVFPNCISPMYEQFKPKEIKSHLTRFGWIGGVYHKEDLKMLKDSFCKLYSTKDTYGKFQICLGGFNVYYTPQGIIPNPEYKDIEETMTCKYHFRYYDKEYMDYLNQYVTFQEHITIDKPYRRLWSKDVYNYAKLYNDIDVALVPLRDLKFNKCKSELKIVEAGWMGKAVIVSDVLPYSKWIVHGKNGLKVNNSRPIDWYLNMKKLIENPDMIKNLAGELNETIKKNFDIKEYTTKRANLYREIISK